MSADIGRPRPGSPGPRPFHRRWFAISRQAAGSSAQILYHTRIRNKCQRVTSDIICASRLSVCSFLTVTYESYDGLCTFVALYPKEADDVFGTADAPRHDAVWWMSRAWTKRFGSMKCRSDHWSESKAGASTAFSSRLCSTTFSWFSPSMLILTRSASNFGSASALDFICR